MASKPEQFVLHVIFEEREDGGLRARCLDVPNFYLSHSDRELVLKDVEPALETILSDMYGVPIRVRRLPEKSEVLDHQMPLPDVFSQQSYAGQLEAA
jgi:hypothetical protein